MNTSLIERVARILSLLGLLGLIGVAGVVDPQLGRFSALSFLSYACYFRFFGLFAKPRQNIPATSLGIWILGAVLGGLAVPFYSSLFSISPMFGLIGFAGLCGLYEPKSDAAPQARQAAGNSRAN
jgi:ABC-type transport system involved in multi-copper enzyme maturation permease subunit